MKDPWPLIAGAIIGLSFIAGESCGEGIGAVEKGVKDARCIQRFRVATTGTDTARIVINDDNCAKLLQLVEQKEDAK